jgi:hypothetical protein
MRNPLILAWWLFLLSSLEITALILDRSHHLEWGHMGLHLIKAGYLGFACVIFVRYLSFRSQKNFEQLVESYNRVAKKTFEGEKQRKGNWVNPFWNLLLVVFATVDFTLVFQWNEGIFKASVLLDLLIWMLLMRWLTRTYWLKTKGTRERLKEVLDDTRSRLREQLAPETEVVEKSVSKAPFHALSLTALAFALGLSYYRWHQVRAVFRVDDLKACMERSMRTASQRFYQHGDLHLNADAVPCVRALNGKVDMNLDLHQGELFLRAVESDGVDYFGNGSPGDQGLVLDASARFRRSWSPNISEPH